jgi:hypothetical protein
MHAVDGYARPAQATDNAQPAVVHDVGVELEYDRRCAGIDWVLVASHRDTLDKTKY